MFPSEKKCCFVAISDTSSQNCALIISDFQPFIFLFFYFQVFARKSQKKKQIFESHQKMISVLCQNNRKKDSKCRSVWLVWSFMLVTDLVKVVDIVSFLLARQSTNQRKGLGFLVSINFDTLVHTFGYLECIGLPKTRVINWLKWVSQSSVVFIPDVVNR